MSKTSKSPQLGGRVKIRGTEKKTSITKPRPKGDENIRLDEGLELC